MENITKIPLINEANNGGSENNPAILIGSNEPNGSRKFILW